MDYIHRLERKYLYINKIQGSMDNSFRAKIEAKYAIVETIKKFAAKILKAALPALILFSTAGHAKIKDPNELGKKLQEISTHVAGKAEVKTHILQNDPDQPQIIVYTLKVSHGSDSPSTATIKYIEGKGATMKAPSWQKDEDEANLLGNEFKVILTALDAQGKKQAGQTTNVVQK
jgi:hypothetical protein